MGWVPGVEVRLRDGAVVLLRTAEARDAAALAALRRDVAMDSEFLIASGDESAASDATYEARVARSRQADGRIMLVAVAGTQVVGVLAFAAGTRARQAHRGRFSVWVALAWRGRGVGTALIRRLIEWAKDHPTIEKVGLCVRREHRAAIRLYRALGFKRDGFRRGEYRLGPGRYDDQVHMSLWVKPPPPPPPPPLPLPPPANA